jgi:hypothetical protein
MENVVNKICITPHCTVRVSNYQYNGYCLRCAIHNNLQVRRNYKTKENTVFEFVKSSFPDFTWIQDRRVEDGCSGFRPDIRVDFGSHVLIIEVDEERHSNYDCSCESKRLFGISQDLGCRPIHLIRFNPDRYENEDTGEIVKSCWKQNGLGILKVPKKFETEWYLRLNKLKEHIIYASNNIPNHKVIFSKGIEILISIEELFFF